MPPEEKYVPKYPTVKNMIQDKLSRPTDDFLVKAVEQRVQMEDLVRWGLAPAGELRADTTPKASKAYGQAVWEMINGIMP